MKTNSLITLTPGEGLGRADDLQVCLRRRSLRRWQGWTLHRPKDLLRHRTGEDDQKVSVAGESLHEENIVHTTSSLQ